MPSFICSTASEDFSEEKSDESVHRFVCLQRALCKHTPDSTLTPSVTLAALFGTLALCALEESHQSIYHI